MGDRALFLGFMLASLSIEGVETIATTAVVVHYNQESHI